MCVVTDAQSCQLGRLVELRQELACSLVRLFDYAHAAAASDDAIAPTSKVDSVSDTDDAIHIHTGTMAPILSRHCR